MTMLYDAPLTMGEYMSAEKLPLAMIFREVLAFLAHRRDAALFGAQAVNAYCDPPRMTKDVDVMALDASGLADALRKHLVARFHVAVRVREVVPGGFRVYQARKAGNRHLVDVRQVVALPETRLVAGVRVVSPTTLLAMKTTSLAARACTEKGLSDRLDLHRLLNAFPALRGAKSPVVALLDKAVARAIWSQEIKQRYAPDDEDEKGRW